MLRIHSLRVRSKLLAEARHARFSCALRRSSTRKSRVEATKDLYTRLYGQSRRATDLLHAAEDKFLSAVKTYRRKHAVEALRWTGSDENREQFSVWFERHGAMFETRGAEIAMQDAGLHALSGGLRALIPVGDWILWAHGDFVTMSDQLFTDIYEEMLVCAPDEQRATRADEERDAVSRGASFVKCDRAHVHVWRRVPPRGVPVWGVGLQGPRVTRISQKVPRSSSGS